MTSGFEIRITIWSLVNKSSLHIMGPEHAYAYRTMALSPDQSLIAVLESNHCDISRSIDSSRMFALNPQGAWVTTESTTHLSCKAHSEHDCQQHCASLQVI